MAFSWNAANGGKYQLQYATDLATRNWADLGPALIATNAIASASRG
ncbi:MAG TPA: hypothetical protein VHI52_04060 [Verrucomicrobiae bacterium]|nr:hypothetical protein [Verrucomicrobiae bacterium]